jgi:hypothetical protein
VGGGETIRVVNGAGLPQISKLKSIRCWCRFKRCTGIDGGSFCKIDDKKDLGKRLLSK